MKMYLHKEVLAVDTPTAALAEAEMGKRKWELPLLTDLLLLRNNATAVSAICLDTPESLVHSGDSLLFDT